MRPIAVLQWVTTISLRCRSLPGRQRLEHSGHCPVRDRGQPFAPVEGAVIACQPAGIPGRVPGGDLVPGQSLPAAKMLLA